MAAKMNMMRLLQEVEAFAEVMNRRPQAKASPFVLQLRPPSAKQPPRRKRTIRIDMQDLPDIPNPVRIIHLQTSAASATVAP